MGGSVINEAYPVKIFCVSQFGVSRQNDSMGKDGIFQSYLTCCRPAVREFEDLCEEFRTCAKKLHDQVLHVADLQDMQQTYLFDKLKTSVTLGQNLGWFVACRRHCDILQI